MALNRWRVRFDGSERVDLPDFRQMMNRAYADFDLLVKALIDNELTPRVLRRYQEGVHTANTFKLMKDVSRAFLDLNQQWLYVNTDAGGTTQNLTVLNSVTNYIEVRLLFTNDDLQTRAFWDTDIGLTGQEFFDEINVRTRLDEEFSVNQLGFQGGSWIPLFEVDVDGVGTITDVRRADDLLWKPRAFSLPAAANRADVYEAAVQDLKSFIDFTSALMSEVKGTGQSLESMAWSNIKLLREYQNIFFTGGGNIEWEGSQGPDTLGLSANLIIKIIGRSYDYQVDAQAIALLDGEVAYVSVPEGAPVGSLPVLVDDIDAVPINPLDPAHDPKIVVLFYRRGTQIFGSLDMPELDSGEVAVIGVDLPTNIRARLGITGESSYEAYSAAAISAGVIAANDSYAAAISKLASTPGTIKANHIDIVTTVLPVGTAHTIDGQAVADGDVVLFADPAINGLYKVSGVGVALAWAPVNAFGGTNIPSPGDWVSVVSATTDYLKTNWRYRDATIGWRPTEIADLTFEPTGFPTRDTSKISFDDLNREFKIEPKAPATFFDIVCQGVIHRKSAAETIVIPDIEGQHYIYYDGATLVTSQSFSYDILKKFAFVARIYWDATNNVSVTLGDERHGITLDAATHRYLHFTVGTKWVSGLSAGNFTTVGTGAADADSQISIGDGLIFDEDLDFNIVDDPAPTEDFEQILDPIAEIPVLYRSGVNGDWRSDLATQFPVKQGAARIKYNDPAGPWTTPDATGDGKFVAMWIFATHNIDAPVLAVLGQREDSSLSDAQANNTYESLSFGELPVLEMKVLYRLIFETSSLFANTPKAALRDVRDLRQAVDTSLAAYAASDHGLLTGLNDPDHGPTAVTTTGVTKDGGLSASDTDMLQTLDTLNKLFGQLRIKPHPTLSNRAIITGSDRDLNSGTKLIQTLKSLVADFDGAQIEFSTGSIYKADGVTPLGINFTPFVIPANQYFYYSVHIIASTVNANNTISAQILVLPASGANAALANAPRPAFAKGATPIGTVWVQESGGGVAAITAANIGQLGSGVGGGSGSVGSGTLFIEELRRRLEDDGQHLQWMTPNVMEVHEANRIDGSSTGSYDIANSEYDLDATEFLLSTQHYNSKFLSLQEENLILELQTLWNVKPTSATYQVSQDGGATLETVSMDQIGDSNKFRGVHVLSTPAGSVQSTYAVANANATAELNATTRQSYAIKQPAVPSGTKKRMVTGTIYVNKVGSPTGDLTVKLVSDNGGVPGTTILGQNKDTISIASLSAGNNAIAIEIPAIITAQTYWLVIETSAAYKSGFSTGVTALEVRVDNTAPAYSEGDSYQYDGSTWAAHAGNQAVFELVGFDYDLRVKITSTAGSGSLVGYGIFYGEQAPTTYQVEQNIQRFDVDGSLNTTQFTITKFIPDAMKLRVYDVNSGQVYRYPAFALDGRKVVFANNQFLSPGETIIVLFDQSEQGAFDNSDVNGNLLASNHLGSSDPEFDRSIAGRGIVLRRPDGTLREITLDDSDNIVILSVP